MFVPFSLSIHKYRPNRAIFLFKESTRIFICSLILCVYNVLHFTVCILPALIRDVSLTRSDSFIYILKLHLIPYFVETLNTIQGNS